MNLTFGEKIKNARKAKKLTQKQLAEKIGAAHNSISDWENDKNKPDPDTIESLCWVLEITPNYLLATSSDDFSPAEKLLIKMYNDLDPHGREMVDIVLNKEHERVLGFGKLPEKNKVTHIEDARTQYAPANAAHERMGEYSEEDRLNDENMMD